MKLHEWLATLDDFDIPEGISRTRPLEVVILAKVLEPDDDEVCVAHFRSGSISFWEATGMCVNYAFGMLTQSERDDDD